MPVELWNRTDRFHRELARKPCWQSSEYFLQFADCGKLPANILFDIFCRVLKGETKNVFASISVIQRACSFSDSFATLRHAETGNKGFHYAQKRRDCTGAMPLEFLAVRRIKKDGQNVYAIRLGKILKITHCI